MGSGVIEKTSKTLVVESRWWVGFQPFIIFENLPFKNITKWCVGGSVG